MAEGETTNDNFFQTVEGLVSDIHLTKDAEGTIATGVRRETVTLQGTWSDLYILYKELAQGVKILTPPSGAEALRNKTVATARIVRKESGMAELSVTVISATGTCYWSLDWATVTKDIHTWHSDEAEYGSDRPDLSQILAWEQLAATGDMDSYNAFLPAAGGEAMTGETLTLAKKIRMGVTSYTLHAPILTRTIVLTDMHDYFATRDFLDTVVDSTQIGVPQVTDPPQTDWSHAGEFPYGTVLSFKKKWILTMDRITGNADGTFTVVTQWLGADEIDADLYQDNSGGYAATPTKG